MEREGEEKSVDKEGDKKPLVFRGTVENRITTAFNGNRFEVNPPLREMQAYYPPILFESFEFSVYRR